MVRQVHIVPKLLPGSMINHKNYFWEITKFVKKMICKKRWSCIFEYHLKCNNFRGKSFKFAKSRDFRESKLVRWFHITLKYKSLRCHWTNHGNVTFVRNMIISTTWVHLPLCILCKFCWFQWKIYQISKKYTC